MITDKARRRIKRQIATGEKQARVHQLDDRTFEYRVKHYVESLFFKLDSIGRLRLTK